MSQHSWESAENRYRMFEVNMDEYLEEETECIKQALDSICKKWDHQVRLSSGLRMRLME